MEKSPLDYWLSGFAVFCMVVGALFGGVIVALTIGWSSPLGHAINQSPLFLGWAILLVAEGAVAWAGAIQAGAAAWYAGKMIRGADVADAPTRNFIWITSTCAAVLVVLVGVWLFGPRATLLKVHWPLGDAQTRPAGVTAFILLPPITAIVAMWLLAIGAVYESGKRVDGSPQRVQALITAHLERHDRVQGLLWYIGVVIGGGVLATGMLRYAMLNATYADATYADDKTFPSSLVLAYGAFFTLLVVVCYVPAHLLVQHAGKRVLEIALPKTPAATILDWKKTRAEMLGLLRLDAPLQDTLKNTIAILAPILASLASIAFPK